MMAGGEVFSQGAISTTTNPFTFVNLATGYHFTRYLSLVLSAGHTVAGDPQWHGYLGMHITDF